MVSNLYSIKSINIDYCRRTIFSWVFVQGFPAFYVLQRNTSAGLDDTNATTTNTVLGTFGKTFLEAFNNSTRTVVQRIIRNETKFGICQVGFAYKKFNYETQYCCHGKPSCIKSKTSGRRLCCSDILPNGTAVTCCNTSVIPIGLLNHAACCDVSFINIDLEFCYHKTRYRKYYLTQTYHKSTGAPQTADKLRITYNIEVLLTCAVSILVSLTIVIRCIFIKSRNRTTYVQKPSKRGKRMENNKLRTVETSFQNVPVEEVEADGYESITDNENLLVQKEDSQNLANGDEKYNCNLSLANHISNKSSQTENSKALNVSNVMGKAFDVRHVFDKNNRSLVLPHSSVKLTLSEEDVSIGSTECYASTFRNLNEIYQTFQKYLRGDDKIVSPTIEYFLPENQRLKKLATIEMDYVYCGCTKNNLSVWRFDSDIKHAVKKEKIPNIDTVNTEKADMFYEIVSNGKIKIYLKHFCTLVCTVCHENHECFTLTGYPYTVTLPSNGIIKHVKVTLYILAGVSQLQDYEYHLEQIDKDNGKRSAPKRINLPRKVTLEDYLAMHLGLWSTSEDIWKEKKIGTHLEDNEKVQLHNIVDCPKNRSNGAPFSMEWHFECNLGAIDQPCSKVVVYTGTFSVKIIDPHPGIDTTRPPTTNFVVTHEVDITDKKHALEQAAGGEKNVPIVESSHIENSTVRPELAGLSYSQEFDKLHGL